MPRAAVGAFIGAAIVVVVLLYAVGAFDTQPRSSRFLAGVCDVPERATTDIVALTTESAVQTGFYDSLDSPEGTPYTVPSRYELVLCNAISISSSVQVGTLEIGYADSAVSATTTAPTTPVLLAAIPSPMTDATLTTPTVIGRVPAGKIPWVRHTPGVDWSAHAVGVLRKAGE